jgi:hypothetical protein
MLDTILVMLLVMAALCVTIITADEIGRLLSLPLAPLPSSSGPQNGSKPG